MPPDLVATPATEPAPPGNGPQGQPVAPVVSNPVTPTTDTPTPAPSKHLTEADVKTAVAQAMRDAQSRADKQAAALHRQYQSQIKELQMRAAQHLQAAGYEDPQALEQQWTMEQQARQYQVIQQEAEQWNRWNAYVAEIATAYGLQPTDPRLTGAGSADDLRAKALAAMQADAQAQRQLLLTDAAQAQQAALDKKIQSGDLDALGGAPSGNGTGFDSTKYRPTDRDELYRLAAQDDARRKQARR